MKTSELRVKIKSLAAEARIIAREERRALRRALHLVREGEAGRLAEAWATYRRLREHRREVVGGAAREALLAYGFLRGLPYARMEPANSSEPDWEGVWKVAERFAPPPDRALVEPEKLALAERYASWRAAAQAHRT